MALKDLIKPYQKYVQNLRRELHEHPELSYEEFETTKRIANELDTFGIPYVLNEETGTGLVAVIDGGKPGKSIALRADIDGLPVEEHNTFAFVSKEPGKMHACGHDGHMAILLGAAKMLMTVQQEIAGRIYLVFQPAEESGRGALKSMKAANWFEETDTVFGGHVWIDLPAGLVSVEAGERMAASDLFEIKITGKNGHGAMPDQAVDSVVVASAIVMNLQSIVSRNFSALDSVVVTVGSIQSGSTWNIIPGSAQLMGTARYFKPEYKNLIKAHIQRVAENTAAAYGAKAELVYKEGVPPTINDSACSALAERVVIDVLGQDKLCPMRKVMAGEDFAWYLKEKPGCFAFIGIRNPEMGAEYDHHHNNFTMDDTVLSAASAVYAQYAVTWLAENSK